MIASFGENYGASTRFERFQNVIEDQRITLLIMRKSGIDGRYRGCASRDARRDAEFRIPQADTMLEAAQSNLGLRADAVAHRAALHENDWVVSIFPGNRRR
jgi:hypothetical protein